MTRHAMRIIGHAVVATTIVCAIASLLLLGSATMPLIIAEAGVVAHAGLVASYWFNRSEDRPAQYFTQIVSESWEGDPNGADYAMLVPTIGSPLMALLLGLL